MHLQGVGHRWSETGIGPRLTFAVEGRRCASLMTLSDKKIPHFFTMSADEIVALKPLAIMGKLFDELEKSYLRDTPFSVHS